MKKLKGIIPLPMIKLGLFLKLVPSLVIDVIDILFDTIYFAEIVSTTVLDSRIHVRPHIYIILFTFQITGTIKNAILVSMAIKKLTPKSVHSKTNSGSVVMTQEMDHEESLLRDTNGYMYITFLQTILAFMMQDAPEALTQYFYVDKYLESFNTVLVVACCMRFIMSARVCLIYYYYVKRFVDPDYHSLKARVMMWGMVAVKFIIFCAHGLRSFAVIRTNNVDTNLACYEHEEGQDKIYQGPWNMKGCLEAIDITLLTLSGVSFVGVFVGVAAMVKYGDKVYNQSHYTGRTGMVSVGRGLTPNLGPLEKISLLHLNMKAEASEVGSKNEESATPEDSSEKISILQSLKRGSDIGPSSDDE